MHLYVLCGNVHAEPVRVRLFGPVRAVLPSELWHATSGQVCCRPSPSSRPHHSRRGVSVGRKWSETRRRRSASSRIGGAALDCSGGQVAFFLCRFPPCAPACHPSPVGDAIARPRRPCSRAGPHAWHNDRYASPSRVQQRCWPPPGARGVARRFAPRSPRQPVAPAVVEAGVAARPSLVSPCCRGCDRALI